MGQDEQDLQQTTPDKKAEPVASIVPSEVQSAMQKLAEKKPEKLIEFMAMEASAIGNPLQHKMTPEHISQVLDLAAKHDEREYDLNKRSQENSFKEGKSNRAYLFLIFIVVTSLVIFILWQFKDKTDVLIPLLTGIGGFLSGFMGGWGLGKKQD